MNKYLILPFFTAVQFLTRIPVPNGSKPSEQKVFQRVVLFMPLVGMLIGLITAGIFVLCQFVFNALLAAAVAITVELFVTGAFHEDAVADYFDAFGGGWTKDDILRKLKDSRIGSYGATALIIALVLRILAIASLDGILFQIVVITASASIGRLATVISVGLLKPVESRESLAKEAGHNAKIADVIIAVLLIFPVFIIWGYLTPAKMLVSLVVIAVLLGVILRKIHKLIGGITGDCLGMICYMAQIVVLVVSAASWRGLN
ncbi:Cobalamin synthase [Sedimentisphaera cyanobacteriorum]|uniref:Adenosylcobinamide-GDP ribazoletransferase n=1 Tax=Sedimentisphaera cyanobacteriorum TaxID=1940790 RepID=A0A1Q2HRK2_9BACT|nr:adenosylcobinamide-GDP ribazoletransferase [Sedimentisphaera cyanobacteriorum]AQQ09876.1 Cobalamin synthase [Sedimentisphaera cyanobacteriorum]